MEKSFIKVFIVARCENDWRRLSNFVALVSDVEVVHRYEHVLDTSSAIKKFPPDILLLDIDLPMGQGIPLLKRIASENPSLKIIVLSNYASPQYRRICEQAGAVLFYDKATDFHQIPLVLKHFFQQKKLQYIASNHFYTEGIFE